MIGRTSPQQNRKLQQKPQQGGLLSSRILNALPYTESVKDYYLRTKQRNEVLRIGLNFAEACASTAATPFFSKYEALDRFAGKQLDKLEEQYGDNLIAKSVGAAVYPIGFTLGLAGYARNKVLDVANPAIQMSYEWADVVVDNLLPPDYDETMEDEYRRMKNLQLKSPMSRIRERTNLHSIRLLPSNAFKFSWHVFSSAAYMGMGITTMSLERMMNTVNLLLGKINFVFEEVLEHPWTAISNTDFAKLYHSMSFYGVRSVIGYINEVEKLALELSDYLENRNLTYNAEVVGFLANKIKLLERRLVRLGGVIQESSTQELKAQSTSTPRKVEGHRPRMIMNTPRRVVAPDERIPSMLLGERKPSLAQEKQVAKEAKIEEIEEIEVIEESEPAEPEHNDEAKQQSHNSMFSRVSANRAKYSSKLNAKRLAAKQQATLEKARHLEIVKSQKKEEIVEEPVDPNVDEYGFAPVRPKAHDHLLPASVAKEMGKEMLLKPHQNKMPVTPTNSPADALNNPFAPIGVAEDKIVAGPTALVNLDEVEKHQKGLRHKALHEMLKVVSEKLSHDEGAQRAERHAELPVWQEAKHPVHKHHEAPAPKLNEDELPASENNPFGKLVEADEDPLSIGVSSM